MQNLKYGSRGPDVEKLQTDLNTIAGHNIVIVNGIFDSLTEDAVRDLQGGAGITVDGIYGPETARVVGAAVADRTAQHGEQMLREDDNTGWMVAGLTLAAAGVAWLRGRKKKRPRRR